MSRVRVAYTAGEAIGPDLFTFYRSIGINLKQLYGSTETARVRLPAARPRGQADTVGVPRARRGDQDRRQRRDAGQVARLLKEYYKRPGATAEVLDADGWFHTGDAGFFDATAT
jgi:long-chain acyl-CoA synthetase